MKGNLGVRKGSWAQEEDVLLRKCIDKYGEGNWHRVPLRAGLNRCRKSCRLRWLNYLRPNIKRGDFASDEVDLIFRLHKLLGNRWSLIAGRLPGRTANDVKNYWNSHMQKKLMPPPEEPKPKDKKTSTTDQATTVTKPRPRTFSKNVQWRVREETSIGNNAIMIQPKASRVSEPSLTLMSDSMLTDDDQATTVIKPRPRTFSKNVQWRVREETSIGNNAIMIKPKELCVSEPTPTLMSDSMLTDDYRADVNLQWWWSSLLLAADKEEIGANIWKDEISPTKAQAGEASIMQEEGLEDWSDFSLDHDFWSFLNSGDQV